MISIENLYFLGGGFGLGILVCLILGRLWFFVYSKKIKNLSSEALFDNSTRFIQLAEKYFTGYAREARKDFDIKGEAIIKSVEPVRQAIEKYDTHLGLMERDRDKAFGSIYSQMVEMSKSQQHLQAETGNLVKALRLPHVRGRWGEITLRRVAELSGMAPHCDFEEQMTQGAGKGALRPDMIVTLPGNRHIIVDSKVPLAAYLDALEASTKEGETAFLNQHAQQVLAHIHLLSSKNYFKELPFTPEFVVLFIPGENYFSAALAQKPDLIEKGVEKGVILATPATLIALLKAVAYSWKQQKGYENAEKIRDLGNELFTRLCTMTENMNRLGNDIGKCVSSYNRTVGALETRVMASARKFEDLGIASGKMGALESIDDHESHVKQLHPGEPDDPSA